MGLHSGLTANHVVHNYTYADATTRNAATGFVSGDVGKIAKQTDTGEYFVLTATTPTWKQCTNPSTTKGDLPVYSTTAVTRLGVGSNGQVLTADSTVTEGIKWATPSGSSVPVQSYGLANYGLQSSVSANAWTIALKQYDGSTDPSGGVPVTITYRSATASTGSATEVSTTAALSVVVPSGTTIGTVSGRTHYPYLYAINTGSGNVLGISLTKFDDGSIQSSSAISGGSSASTLYSTSAQSNKPIRLIGRATISEATTGTWATNASELSLVPFKGETVISSVPGPLRMEIFRIDFESSGSVIEYDPGSAISSVTRNGTGDYNVNFNTAFTAQKSYAVSATFTASQGFVRVDQPSSSQIEVLIRNTSGSLADGFVIHFIVVGPK